jgi:capsid portal protein
MKTRYTRASEDRAKLETESNNFRKMNKELQDKLNMLKLTNEEL